MLTWHVVMHKVEGRAAAYFIADKDSTGGTPGLGGGPHTATCLLPPAHWTADFERGSPAVRGRGLMCKDLAGRGGRAGGS